MREEPSRVSAEPTHLVRCKRNWPGPFRRCLRDANGSIRETMEFPPGETVALNDEQFAAVQGDLGVALELVPEPLRPTSTATDGESNTENDEGSDDDKSSGRRRRPKL